MSYSRLNTKMLWILTAVAALAVVMALSGCDEDDIERSIGSQTAAAVEKEYTLDHDPLLNEWVNNMGQTLVAHSRRQHIPYSFQVIDTDMVNAFAAPYGHIYFLRGLLDFADTEDEVWFICGHEITHVVQRDSIKSLKKSLLYSLGAAILGGKSETLGEVAGLGAGLLMLHYSRDDERDADDGGCDLSYAAGYDPHGGISFFEKLQAKYEKGKPSQLEHLLLTHPPTPNRIGRQLSRAIFDADNAAATIHIARGHQRRFQYRAAAQLFRETLQTHPQLPEAHAGLADCYAAVGLLPQAQQSYQAALNLNSNNTYVSRQLAALPEAPTPLPTMSPAETSMAAVLLGQLANLRTAMARTKTQSAQLSSIVAERMSDAAKVSRNSTGTILGISDTNPDFSDDQRSLFMVASSAVNGANNTVYAIEALDSRFQSLSTDCDRAQTRLASTLRACAAGNGQANDVEIAKRSWLAMGNALADLDAAVSQTPDAIAAANHAQRAVADTMIYIELMTKNPETDTYDQGLKQAVARTEELTQTANAAVGKVKKITRRAEARALLARINVAALGLRPEIRQAFDGLVAHYVLTRPEQVTELRQLGFGHGDAAFALAAARSVDVAPEAYSATLSSSSLIDTLANQGVKLDGAIVLLDYLANAMEREVELAQAAG